MQVHVRFGRKVQPVQFEPIDYGIAITDDCGAGETPEQALVRVHNLATAYFNAVEECILTDHGIEADSSVTLSPLEVEERIEEPATVAGDDSAPPPPRRKNN